MHASKIRTIQPLLPILTQNYGCPERKGTQSKRTKWVKRIQDNTENTQAESLIGDVYTTIGSSMDMLAQDEFLDLHKIILHEASSFACFLKFDIKQYLLKINECWLNVYRAGNSQEPHNHANSVFSGIYFVKQPKTDTTELNRVSVRYEPTAGQMLVFRSHLMHAVKSSPSDDERISIAFNVTM